MSHEQAPFEPWTDRDAIAAESGAVAGGITAAGLLINKAIVHERAETKQLSIVLPTQIVIIGVPGQDYPGEPSLHYATAAKAEPGVPPAPTFFSTVEALNAFALSGAAIFTVASVAIRHQIYARRERRLQAKRLKDEEAFRSITRQLSND